jgi:hypothetical protein
LINLSPTWANLGITPEHKYSNQIPNVDHLRTFGCVAYLHVPKENRKKLDSKTLKCLLLGYDRETKGYRLYDHSRRKVIINRDAVFDESLIGYHHLV